MWTNRWPLAFELLQTGQQVVAIDIGDARREPEVGSELGEAFGQTGRVDPSGVGNDLDPAVEAGPEHLFHLGDEGAGIALVGITLPGPPEDRHGELGQIVTGQHVDRPALHHLPGGRSRSP